MITARKNAKKRSRKKFPSRLDGLTLPPAHAKPVCTSLRSGPGSARRRGRGLDAGPERRYHRVSDLPLRKTLARHARARRESRAPRSPKSAKALSGQSAPQSRPPHGIWAISGRVALPERMRDKTEGMGSRRRAMVAELPRGMRRRDDRRSPRWSPRRGSKAGGGTEYSVPLIAGTAPPPSCCRTRGATQGRPRRSLSTILPAILVCG
jgi:hypothetical protein